MRATERKHEEGAATQGGAPLVDQRRPGPMARLASVRLTLWLLAVLLAGMMLATFMPVLLRTSLGPLVAKTTLRDVYGSWWFIGAFALLAVNLFACTLQRTGQLLRENGKGPALITRAQVLARGHRARWRVSAGVEQAADLLATSLRRQGYTVSAVPGEAEDQRGVLARRGRLAPWTPVVVHVGMLIILAGAAWGRLPSHTYRDTAALAPGETFPVKVGEDAFSLRLVAAGEKRDARGRPTDFWAKTELLEEGNVIRSEVIRPNHPLRYHGVSVVLQSLTPAGYSVEVVKGASRGFVPVVLGEGGAVDMMSTIRRLDDPPWIVFVHELRSRDEQGREALEAKVFVDRSGEMSHNWQLVGWVGEQGLDYGGVRFRLVPASSGVQFSLDRDVGIPAVWLGLIVIGVGSVLTLGAGRRSLVALVTPRGQGSQVVVGASRSAGVTGWERVLQQLQSELGAKLEAELPPKEEA